MPEPRDDPSATPEPESEGNEPGGAPTSPPDGSSSPRTFEGDVEIQGKHVVVAAAVHVALIAATYILLGWTIWCALALLLLFFLFPKLVEAVARAWG